MHRHHEDITKVNLLLTKPSQVSDRRLCTSAEAAATARGSAHPNLKQRRTAEQNSTDPPFQADNPIRSHLSILAPPLVTLSAAKDQPAVLACHPERSAWVGRTGKNSAAVALWIRHVKHITYTLCPRL